MALSAAQQQRMILLELGLQTDLAAAELVSLLWDEHADKARTHPRLQRLYAKRALVESRILQNWELHDAADEGVRESFSQQIRNLEGQVEQLTTEITALESQARGSASPAAGALTTTTPLTRDTAFQADPNDRRYKGDPLRRPFGSRFP